MITASLSSPTSDTDGLPACSIEPSPADVSGSPLLSPVVGAVRLDESALPSLSDDELQDYINTCAREFIASHDRYQATGSFADAGERDAWWQSERDALIERGCRPNVVSRMERERGLI